MVLNICNFIQRTEQVPVELDISAIEDYILILLLLKSSKYHKMDAMQLRRKRYALQ